MGETYNFEDNCFRNMVDLWLEGVGKCDKAKYVRYNDRFSSEERS